MEPTLLLIFSESTSSAPRANIPPADCKPRVGRYVDCSLPAFSLYRGNGIRITALSNS